jgi:hypothetical protein
MKFRDKRGWPIERIKGRPVTNFIRLLIHTNLKKTLFHKRTGCKKFTVKVEMPERWIPHFMSMLKYMESLGAVGSSREVAIYADGDGDFHPRFETNIKYETKKPVRDNHGNRMYDAG